MRVVANDNQFLGVWPFPVSPIEKISIRAAISSSLTEKQYREIDENIYRAYEVALLEGYTRFDPRVKGTYALTDYIVTKTGLDRVVIFNWLAAMYALAQAGEIPVELWSPIIERETLEIVEAATPKEPTVLDKFFQPLYTDVKKGYTSAFNKTLITAGIIGALYLAGPPIIKEFSKRR